MSLLGMYCFPILQRPSLPGRNVNYLNFSSIVFCHLLFLLKGGIQMTLLYRIRIQMTLLYRIRIQMAFIYLMIIINNKPQLCDFKQISKNFYIQSIYLKCSAKTWLLAFSSGYFVFSTAFRTCFY